MKLLYSALVLLVCARTTTAQAPAPVGRLIGEVVSVHTAAGKISMRADTGGEVLVTLTEKTLFLRVPPGEKDLQKASRIKLADIAAGDRVLARGPVSEDGGAIAATSVIVMSRTELAQKQARERAEWQTRGAAGRVSSIDATNRRMVIAGSSPGDPPLTVEWSETTGFRRYLPDSVRFSEVKPGAASDIQAGDQVRVLGDRTGGLCRAEQIVSGSFRQVAGTVVSVHALAGEIRITDLASRKPLTVRLIAETNMKRMPPDVAAAMGKRLSAAGASGRAPDLHSAIDRWPALTVAELKTGDALILAGSAGTDPARVTAITLIAGVEPLLTAAPARAADLGGWNFGEIGLPQ